MRFPIAIALVAACGTAASAQQDPSLRRSEPARPAERAAQPSHRNQEAVRARSFIASDWVMDADIVSASNRETLGEIDDLAIAPADGKVVYAIISRGGVMGVGSKHVAVPWRSLTWNIADRNFTLPMTEQQLAGAPEFDKNQWPMLVEPSFSTKVRRFFGMDDDRGPAASRDQGWMETGHYQSLIKDGQKTTLRGTVENVDKTAPGRGMSEGYLITVADQQGQRHVVHLGPAWFLEHQNALPREGQQVEIQGSTISLDGKDVVAARTVSAPGGNLRLRDEQGRPVWDASAGGQATADRPVNAQPGEPARPQDRVFAAPEARAQNAPLLKATSIIGQDLRTADGEDAGEIESLVFDSATGRTAFARVAFGGFLGIGETDVAVPWKLFTVDSEGKLTLNKIDKEQLRSAPRLENDWDQSLNDPNFTQRVYQHFGLDAGWLTKPDRDTDPMEKDSFAPGRDNQGRDNNQGRNNPNRWR